jgi:hypothetical protein
METLKDGHLMTHETDAVNALRALRFAKGSLAGVSMLLSTADGSLRDCAGLKRCFDALQNLNDRISETMEEITFDS